jgi:hypothetical protein
MSALDEVEEMNQSHFWALVAAFACAALLHAYFDKALPDDDPLLSFLIVIGWGAAAYVCGRLRERRGGQFAVGVLLGLLFGFFAIPFVLLVPIRVPRPGSARKSCDRCFTSVRREASMCAACGQALNAWRFEQGKWWWQDKNGDVFRFDERSRGWVVDPSPPPARVIPPPPATVLPEVEDSHRQL